MGWCPRRWQAKAVPKLRWHRRAGNFLRAEPLTGSVHAGRLGVRTTPWLARARRESTAVNAPIALLSRASVRLGAPVAELQVSNGVVSVASDRGKAVSYGDSLRGGKGLDLKVDPKVAKGRGIAYVRYSNTTTYVAAVAEVEVNRKTGEVKVSRVCIGHDCGQIINPDGLANQIEGGVIQTVSRTLLEQVQWDRTKVTSVDWATYPILRFPNAPRVEVDMINIPGEVSWGAGEPTATTIPAAIANAIYDATGARVRSVPFTPEKVLAALAASGGGGVKA